ncbi:hypothetical protein FRUB_05091 [Fimbriiglobus ruber]|uniref:Uncharacterized protein n=1 Tax=Fimbriiglobus ruber TaxID=1908690 RepID=A0A225DFB6_9BACT|nr:hypothetical protein FRUB_05091 [Fimbriiglobus ruber]
MSGGRDGRPQLLRDRRFGTHTREWADKPEKSRPAARGVNGYEVSTPHERRFDEPTQIAICSPPDRDARLGCSWPDTETGRLPCHPRGHRSRV